MLTQQQSPLKIIYHNGPCIVVNKPAGVLTQAVPGIDSMEVRVKDYVRRQEKKTGNVYVAVTHRLDRPVTGALIFARHVRAARRICEQFAGRIVQKTYWALVEGQVTESAGTWTDHIRKIPDVARAELVPEDHPDSRSAILRFKRVAMNKQVHPVGNSTRNWPYTPNPGAGRRARTSGAGRRALWQYRGVRTAGNRSPSAGDWLTRPASAFPTPHDSGTGRSDGSSTLDLEGFFASRSLGIFCGEPLTCTRFCGSINADDSGTLACKAPTGPS